MAYDQDTKAITATEKQKSILVRQVVWVRKLKSLVIEENRLCFFKGNAMFPLIRPVFGFVPFESNHNYSIIII